MMGGGPGSIYAAHALEAVVQFAPEFRTNGKQSDEG